MRFLVTGGAGFIGSALCRALASRPGVHLTVLDKLTYAGRLSSLAAIVANGSATFFQGDVADPAMVASAFQHNDPDVVLHLAAESHVDRSIDGPLEFVATNVMGTAVVLEAARAHWGSLPSARRDVFRFVHISTDEVFGALGAEGLFDELTPYDPSSPYAASKAGADHLTRAWGRTYGLPVIVTNCSNNFGPYQFPEKLIPLAVLAALRGQRCRFMAMAARFATGFTWKIMLTR